MYYLFGELRQNFLLGPSHKMPLFFCRLFFFFSATKWKNCAILPRGHWALNTMTTNCDPIRFSHADHASYLDDDWSCHARTEPVHMTNHEIFAATITDMSLYDELNLFYRWPIVFRSFLHSLLFARDVVTWGKVRQQKLVLRELWVALVP